MKLAKIDWGAGRKSMLYLKFMIYYTVTLALLAGVLTYNTAIVSMVGAKAGDGTEAELAKVTYKNILLALILVAVFLVATAILFSRWITRPLRELTRAANVVAREGDLTETVPVRSKDEVGELAEAFNQMIYNLGSLVKHIQDGGMQIGSSSRDILVASEQQASGSTEQASAVNEISVTMEELAATSKQIADNASSVTDLAEQTLSSAQAGKETVNDSVEGMDEIRDATEQIAGRILDLGQKSQDIGRIIEMISSIADRTDLLALNAAIEAAKAGEAGRGFAVLAGEIRILAENVVDSTRQITELLTQIQSSINASVMAMEEGTKKVERGVELANKTGESLDEVLDMIERTTASSSQIKMSTQQQQSASDQAVAAMNEIAEVTRQSEASAKRTATVAKQLAGLSEDLEKAVEQFKIARQEELFSGSRYTEAQKTGTGISQQGSVIKGHP
jgi:methyl-accepting chemotaxis protein